MKKEIELLAPGGDVDSIKAAILAGADAIYCGLDKFNARNRAKNITFEDLNGILRLAHQHSCEIFLTLNIIIVESELSALTGLLNKLVNTTLDGIIIQDLGLFYLLSSHFPTLKIHASTQLTTHNEGQILFLKKLNAIRVNLSREMNIDEITELTQVAHRNGLLTEVFVHGSNCISFSGLCYMSSVHGGNSGNRGRCSQPCRDQYLTTAEGKDFPLNIKDNSAYSDLRALSDAGVDSIKIEGRIKKYHYVYTVVDTWRKQLQAFYQQDLVGGDDSGLRKVFNRDFSNSFLQGNISQTLFIDNPRDHSAIYHSQQKGGAETEKLDTAKRELYDLKSRIIDDVKVGIEPLSINRAPLKLSFSGCRDEPLMASVKTPEAAFVVCSEDHLAVLNSDKTRGGQSLDYTFLSKRFKGVNDTEYFIESLELEGLEPGLALPFKALTALKNRLLFVLNGSREYVNPVELPRLQKPPVDEVAPALSLLISAEEDLYLCEETSAEIYFQLPNSLHSTLDELVELFKGNQRLIPWFPALLIGEDYQAAVSFLQQVQPVRIVTNNSGVAYAAYRQEVSWVAGPHMNLVNSFSLLCLKEQFNCEGAFISNELNRGQIKGIKKPDNFKLYYSISHPIVLMMSRVCMFYQVTGCKKSIVDNKCIERCEKSSVITNWNGVSFFIDKERGGYHHVYNEANFLNTDILGDIPGLFSSLFVDLRCVKTETQRSVEKSELIRLFETSLNGNQESTERLRQALYPTTNTQYQKGI